MPRHNLSIKQWSPADQPREKLRDNGSRFLSDAELLAILIGSGTPDHSALDLSKQILSSTNNNLNLLSKLSLKQLKRFKGIGEAKAIKIIAALELGRRQKGFDLTSVSKINSSHSVFEFMKPFMGNLPHEEFWVLYLNHAKRLLLKTQISVGGMTSTVVDSRLILKKALECGATALILVHNHPSGGVEPSKSDTDITHKLKDAAQTLDIKLLDHIILTEKSYFSFADENQL